MIKECTSCGYHAPITAKTCPSCFKILPTDNPKRPPHNKSPGNTFRNGTTLTDIDIPIPRLMVILLKFWVAAIPIYILTIAVFFTAWMIIAATIFAAIGTAIPRAP